MCIKRSSRSGNFRKLTTPTRLDSVIRSTLRCYRRDLRTSSEGLPYRLRRDHERLEVAGDHRPTGTWCAMKRAELAEDIAGQQDGIEHAVTLQLHASPQDHVGRA